MPEARAHGGARVDPAESQPHDHRAARVARGGAEDRQPAEQLVGAAGDVQAHERHDAGEAEHEAGRPTARHALGRRDEEREERHDQRCGGDDDRRQRGVDVLLAVRDERERQRDLDDREDRDPAPRPRDRPQRPRAPGEPQQHHGGQHDARPGQEDRRHAVVDGQLDEQVRDAPQRRHRGERCPCPGTHGCMLTTAYRQSLDASRLDRRARAPPGRPPAARRSDPRTSCASSPPSASRAACACG